MAAGCSKFLQVSNSISEDLPCLPHFNATKLTSTSNTMLIPWTHMLDASTPNVWCHTSTPTHVFTPWIYFIVIGNPYPNLGELDMDLAIWSFPKSWGYLQSSSILSWDFEWNKPSIWGYPHDELETHYHPLSSTINHILTIINHI